MRVSDLFVFVQNTSASLVNTILDWILHYLGVDTRIRKEKGALHLQSVFYAVGKQSSVSYSNLR